MRLAICASLWHITLHTRHRSRDPHVNACAKKACYLFTVCATTERRMMILFFLLPRGTEVRSS